MEANEAKQCLYQRDSTIDPTMVHFASISNGPKAVWRLDIPREKLNPAEPERIHALLYDYRSAVLYHLSIPKTYLHNHEQRLGVRNHANKNYIALELTTAHDKTMFRNQRPTDSGVEFRQFLHYCIGC